MDSAVKAACTCSRRAAVSFCIGRFPDIHGKVHLAITHPILNISMYAVVAIPLLQARMEF